MGFWILAFGLAGAVAFLLARALLRQGSGAGDAADLALYRAQLREVERDLVRGILPPDEAERARLEISRRMLEADARVVPRGGSGPGFGIALGLGLALAAGSVFLYLRLGAPGAPDLPRAERIALAEELRQSRPSQAEAEALTARPGGEATADPEYLALVAQLREAVAARPDDEEGHRLLSEHEAALGNFAAAHAAKARLIAIKGARASAEDYADLANLLIYAAGGYVSPEAEAALSEALTRDPANGLSRYYSGLLFAQIGRPDLAFRFWAPLLAEGPEEAPWIAPIRGQIALIALQAGEVNYAPPEPQRGPSLEDVEAAEDMAPEDRMAMIRGMVDGLAARLAAEGGPASDWARLIRAFGVLGEAERARPVLDEARRVFANDMTGLSEIEAAAREAGFSP
jgi:cytochrome c-type biogenesis protein CcmH